MPPAKAITATGERRSLDDIEVWIFDLDNTLYPAHCNLFAQVNERIQAYICRFLGVMPEEARTLQKRYFLEHGTTLNGLMLNHGMSPEDFLDYVHDIDVSPRSEERRVWKEWFRKVRSRWSPDHSKKKKKN